MLSPPPRRSTGPCAWRAGVSGDPARTTRCPAGTAPTTSRGPRWRSWESGPRNLGEGTPVLAQVSDPIVMVVKQTGDVRIHTFVASFAAGNIANATHIIETKN